jgi:hypothetical protein
MNSSRASAIRKHRSGVDGAVQYLVVAIFATDMGHHAHDADPRFKGWGEANRR